MTEVRCPGCGKKLGEDVLGYYRTTCPRCHRPVVVCQPGSLRVNDGGRVMDVRAQVVPE